LLPKPEKVRLHHLRRHRLVPNGLVVNQKVRTTTAEYVKAKSTHMRTAPQQQLRQQQQQQQRL